MLLCRLQPTFTTPESVDENVDWEEAARQLPQPLLFSCPNSSNIYSALQIGSLEGVGKDTWLCHYIN